MENKQISIKEKVLETYSKIKTTIDNDDYPEYLIDEYLMFQAIYFHYNFKDNGCPFFDINQVKIDIKIVNFEPKYNIFLQDMYDLLFDSIFNYKVKSTRIKKVKLNIKININFIQFEIYSNRTIKELINLIAEYCTFKIKNFKIKKNNLELDETKKILEYRLDETSRLTLSFNQYG